ncbi:MAG TPA: hypothetical protein VFE25_16825 [Opitutaceae bacterium]|jgi:hypothetical protein|nr:hypothetical protein [Opitutaceae bacterium]
MASRKIKKGPSWLEVGLGAFLAVILGVVLGAAYLVTKTVITAKELPKDAPANAIYYLEGSRNTTSSGAAEEARKNFLAGESVDVTESEVNALAGDGAPSKPAAEKDKPAPADKMLTPGTINVRIREGTIQFGCPVDYNIFTILGTIIVQAKGSFEKHGSGFVFVPDSVMVGGCQVNHLPIVKDLVLSKLLFSHPIPDDMANAWGKLGAVSIEGSTLRLKMQ